MGKKVREYKSGDFIFAKVKGYPAWPARVQKMNGKKYFVYFYGTGETANLPPNMIFDYAENKDKFLTKTVKRRDFNDGVKQIEHDFANNVPLEDVIGAPPEAPADTSANDTANDSAINDTMDETADVTADEDTANESTANETAQNETAVDDSDEAGALVIDEGNKKGKKSKADAKPKDTPVKGKEPKTPRGKAKKEESKEDEEEKKEDEIVSRSGRKIRPKRYIDEQTEENATLPSPAPKKRRGASPTAEKEKEKEKSETKDKTSEKNNKQYNTVMQSELEDLKEPFKQDDAEKENILITYLPTGQYVGIKLFQSRPNNFKNESSRLQWDKQAAANALTLKQQLERGQLKPESVLAQLVMDLNLTDEEKATLDKERETEEKKSRVQFLKTEMKLIELDAKIKTCLCLEKADTELCLKLLDELMELEVKPLMLLKHPTCVETVKRMRAYVGNTPSWDLSESDALVFSKQAHRIRKQADTLYKNMKELFTTPEGLSFWEYFSERVIQFKKVTSKLSADELLEMVHEPLEMSMPAAHNMKSAIDALNEEEKLEEDEENQKKKGTPAKTKKTANSTSTPAKQAVKRQSSRKQQEEKEKKSDTEEQNEDLPNDDKDKSDSDKDTSSKEKDAPRKEKDTPSKEKDKAGKEKDSASKEKEASNDKDVPNKEKDKSNKEKDTASEGKDTPNKEKDKKDASKKDKTSKEKDTPTKEKDKPSKEKDTNNKEKDKASKEKDATKKDKDGDDKSDDNESSSDNQDKDKKSKDSSTKDNEKDGEVNDKSESKDKAEEKEMGEPRAKRSRESKKTEPPPPRSPTKRASKSKF